MARDSTLKPVSLLHAPEDPTGGASPWFTRSLGLTFEQRYERVGVLGIGSMGEVYRVLDVPFARELAMKTAQGALDEPLRLSRFHREAVVTAQLAHPSILPVFDVGRMPDEVPFYTMPIVEGQTLAEHLLEPSELGPRVGILVRVLEALVHAHTRGVIHRDIKPSNIMIGAFGEVFLTDWGLVKLVDPDLEGSVPGPLVQGPSTRMGSVAGTPAYMSPEQALGLSVDRPTDVYAMGAVLYDVLTGTPPFTGRDALDVLEKARSQKVQHPVVRAGRPLPEALVDTCLAMLTRSPADRPTAEQALTALSRWLDGRKRHANAATHLQKGQRALVQAEALREQGLAREREGRSRVVAGDAEAWGVVDQGRELLDEASHLFEHARLAFQHAVAEVPELVEGHKGLVRVHQTLHRIGIESGRATLTQRAEDAVAEHARAAGLVQGELERWIDGVGRVHLPIKRSYDVSVFRLHPRMGRIEAIPLERPASWPAELPAGWLRVDVRKRGSAVSRLIFEVERAGEVTPLADQGWTWVRKAALGPEDHFVPGGVSGLGGVWVDPFILRRFPVTLGEYRAFLEAAGRDVPRHVAAHPRHPVAGLSADEVRAFIAWMRTSTRLPWRVCTADEWERAASPDGRRFPWGDRLRTDWCAIDRVEVAAVDAFPEDEGPYGVRGQAAGVYERCSDAWPGVSGVQVVKSTCWSSAPDELSLRTRRRSDGVRADRLGFRLARSLRT